MTEKELNPLNDHQFLQAFSCPLKFHYTNEKRESEYHRDFFRQRNKLHLRDAVATRFSNIKHTSNDVVEAKRETDLWLKEGDVTICGAVLQHGEFLTRIPILKKSVSGVTIVQIHGKLRKRSLRSISLDDRLGKTVINYLVKAAYRAEIASKIFPDRSVTIEFYFPNKDYKSSIDHLHLHHLLVKSDSEMVWQELEQLFTATDATEAVKSVLEKMPAGIGYKLYDTLSMTEILDKISGLNERYLVSGVKNIHNACRFCQYRVGNKSKPGCWEEHFKPDDIIKPNRHVYELIGHGSKRDLENCQYYQEEITIHDGLQSFDLMKKFGGPHITVQQRRNLQILQSKEEWVPGLWVKSGIMSLKELTFPLHFIDFEAATYSLPMRRGSQPYESVYFQFSCHTLHSDGSIEHTEWLDTSNGENFPHDDFTRALIQIPEIEKGTLIHYSPFEKQALNNLIRGYERNSMLNEEKVIKLKKIRDGVNSQKSDRFFDLSRIVRDFYYNEYMNGGLGLKEVLNSILFWERSSIQKTLKDLEHPVSFAVPLKDTLDPYLHIQTGNNQILDGSSAMNAWISFKSGLLQKEERAVVLELLKRYCELDSYSMVILYHHLVSLLKMRENGSEEIILEFKSEKIL